MQQVTSPSAPAEANDAEFDLVVSLVSLEPPPSSRAFRVLGLGDLERRLLHSAYNYAITNFCMARGHDDERRGHTDRLLFVIDTGCTQHTVRGPQECMTHCKTSRKKISTAVAQWCAVGGGRCLRAVRKPSSSESGPVDKISSV